MILRVGTRTLEDHPLEDHHGSVLDELNKRGIGTLPGLIGISGRLDLREELMAPNGYLRAATVIALADTSCGYGTFVNLPEGAESFTTMGLKRQLRRNQTGRRRTTQVLDATVTDEEGGKAIALFRCTQTILYPR